MKKNLFFIVAIGLATSVFAGNVITYTASEKLPETWAVFGKGLHLDGFNTSITSHEFSEGVGTITFAKDVTMVGFSFYECNITSVNIPASVTSIVDESFSGCSKLASVNIADNSQLIEIGDWVFYNCEKLTSINIPEGVSLIGKYAFYNCSRLTSINIPSAVTEIGKYAFGSCSRLTSINIPSAVTEIGEGAFYGCSNATSSITIPAAVTEIGANTFRGCSKLASVNFADNSQLTEIGDRVFYNCEKLTSINIPEGVSFIGERAFSGCIGLTSVTFLGNDCQDESDIASNAFSNVGTKAAPSTLVLPDNWTGSVPDIETGVWKGGYFNRITTGSPLITAVKNGVVKYFMNGNFFIEYNGVTNDLLGR